MILKQFLRRCELVISWAQSISLHASQFFSFEMSVRHSRPIARSHAIPSPNHVRKSDLAARFETVEGDDHRPLEGHFVVGGSGLFVHGDCLGGVFPSHTATHDLTIRFPQLDTGDNMPELLQGLLGVPPVPHPRVLVPPQWAYGPTAMHEHSEERNITPVWGTDLGISAKTVYPESIKDTALVYRCGFTTALTASTDEEFETLTENFLSELDDWWTRFTSWVGILTHQDFVGLGGSTTGVAKGWPIHTWTSDTTGQRTDQRIRQSFGQDRTVRAFLLDLGGLRACVTATTNDDPPSEWLFIRDARSMLKSGHSRRAVIDAGTAAELAMTKLIDQYLDDVSIVDVAARKAFGRFNNLGAKQELLKLLRPSLLPERTRPDLIDKRNRVSHGNAPVTYEEAETAVEVATKIVSLAYPLSDLLPGAQIP